MKQHAIYFSGFTFRGNTTESNSCQAFHRCAFLLIPSFLPLVLWIIAWKMLPQFWSYPFGVGEVNNHSSIDEFTLFIQLWYSFHSFEPIFLLASIFQKWTMLKYRLFHFTIIEQYNDNGSAWCLMSSITWVCLSFCVFLQQWISILITKTICSIIFELLSMKAI